MVNKSLNQWVKAFRISGRFQSVLLTLLIVSVPSATSAQQMTIPQIPAFLPSVTKVKPSKTMVIDGLWSVSSLNKLVRIDRGRIYAIEGWTHMFVLNIKPGMVIIQNLVEEGDSVFKGEDLPLAGPLKAVLTGDRILDVTVEGALGTVNYQMIPQELDDPDWFKKEIRKLRRAGR